MATGSLNAQGVWIYGEDDSETTFSALLNKLGSSVSSRVGVGSVIQTVSFATDVQAANSTPGTFIATGLTKSITPRYATSKILVIVGQNGMTKDGSSSNGISIQLQRNGSDIVSMAYASGYGLPASYLGSYSVAYLDSPATTSAVTYATKFASFNASANVYAQTGAKSTITLMEIAQ
jgi:hypothetical protein